MADIKSPGDAAVEGKHIFAIGDVHGRADLLGSLLIAIEDRALEMDVDFSVVFLGDIIDHGPLSKNCVEIVAETIDRTPGSKLILGNHDWFPLRILHELTGDQQNLALDFWIRQIGGRATLLSYDFDPDTFSVRDLERHFPTSHLRSISLRRELRRTLRLYSGARRVTPSRSVVGANKTGPQWIREPFLSTPFDSGKIVVHGHSATASSQCEVAMHRIGIDTGAYDTGKLSAIQIKPDGSVAFLQTNPVMGFLVEDAEPVYI